MSIKSALGNTGRKMDAAWKAAISAALKGKTRGGAALAAAGKSSLKGLRVANVSSKLANRSINQGIAHGVSKAGSAIKSGASKAANSFLKTTAGNAVGHSILNAAMSQTGQKVMSGASKASAAVKSGANKVLSTRGGSMAAKGAKLAGKGASIAAKSRAGKVAIVGGAAYGATKAYKAHNSTSAKVKRAVGLK